jgi:hypothetical protein
VSNPFAIAAVTATLSQLVGRVTEDPTLTGTGVTTRPPDRARASTDTGRQLNLFLYQITENAGWRGMDLPSRNENGELIQRPVLPLNLHYLLTAYGQNDEDFDAQHLLAHAMILIHDAPVLTRDQIRAALIAEPAVAQSDLADQIELVKLCPEIMNVEEISKLWTAFQTNFRLSVAYQASVLLIERAIPTRIAKPVRAANLYVLAFRQPVIEAVSPQVLAPGGQLTVQGRNLKADVVQLRFGQVLAAPGTIDDRQLIVTLPATLAAGVNTVQVVQDLNLGTPPTPHRGFSSNIAAFILAPQITTPSPMTAARGGNLSLAFNPPAGRAQRVSILVGDREVVLSARPAGSLPVTTLNFPIPGDMQTGSFLLRLRVDGAESPLEVDTNPVSSTFNQYVAPVVTIT